MGQITQTLIKIKEDIKPLLTEMYPNLIELIDFVHRDNYQEWAGMLFNLIEWQISPELIDINTLTLSDIKSKKVAKELDDYVGMTDFGYISVVVMDGEQHLIDGYHRVLTAKEQGIRQLKGGVWTKEPNTHENCAKIKNLIINNL